MENDNYGHEAGDEFKDAARLLGQYARIIAQMTGRSTGPLGREIQARLLDLMGAASPPAAVSEIEKYLAATRIQRKEVGARGLQLAQRAQEKAEREARGLGGDSDSTKPERDRHGRTPEDRDRALARQQELLGPELMQVLYPGGVPDSIRAPTPADRAAAEARRAQVRRLERGIDARGVVQERGRR